MLFREELQGGFRQNICTQGAEEERRRPQPRRGIDTGHAEHLNHHPVLFSKYYIQVW
jgi:hypothetical protein